MTKIDVQFSLEKETKNTVRYVEEPGEGTPPMIGTIYIQKWVLGTNPAKQIRVVVEEVRDAGKQ